MGDEFIIFKLYFLPIFFGKWCMEWIPQQLQREHSHCAVHDANGNISISVSHQPWSGRRCVHQLYAAVVGEGSHESGEYVSCGAPEYPGDISGINYRARCARAQKHPWLFEGLSAEMPSHQFLHAEALPRIHSQLFKDIGCVYRQLHPHIIIITTILWFSHLRREQETHYWTLQSARRSCCENWRSVRTIRPSQCPCIRTTKRCQSLDRKMRGNSTNDRPM